MAPRYWGEIILPEQRGPFIEQTLSSLHSLAGRVAQYHLGSLRLTKWSCGTKIVADGHKTKQYLHIKANGEPVVIETWGIFLKKSRTRFPNEEELAELLEKQMIGLGDLQEFHTKIDMIVALRELMAMPQVQRLIRPVTIQKLDLGGGYGPSYLLLTSRGIEYKDNVNKKDNELITDPSQINFGFLGRHILLRLDDIRKAAAKLPS